MGGGGMEVGDYSVTVSGGTLVLYADGDGLDSNGTATITGGTVVVNGPEGQGNGALDVNGDFTISGGTLLAAGSSGMAVAPSTESAQASVMANLTTAGSSGTVVQLVASDGTVVASYQSEKSFSSVVFSSPDIVAGEEYTVYVGGSVTGTGVGGYYEGGSTDGGTAATTTTAGEYTNEGMGGPGGGFGGERPGGERPAR